jgi:pimeloyl-ACP methyl ester carboxylesterase
MGGKHILMVHGAFAGAWCFDLFRPVFERNGWTCDAIDLPGHSGAPDDAARLAGLGLSDFRVALEQRLRFFETPPVLLGHSMGAVLAQQLATQGLARALVLLSPAPRAGILPATDAEKEAARQLMGLGEFWTTAIHPDFEVAKSNSLNRIPSEMQRAIFNQFGPESGRALFELFFWMFDSNEASAVELDRVRCPVLCISGSDDRLISPGTARLTAEGLAHAVYWEAPDGGHMLLVEPGAEQIAHRIVDWLPE